MEQRRGARRDDLIRGRDDEPGDRTGRQGRQLRDQSGIGRGLTGPGTECIVRSSVLRTMVRMATGGIDVTERAGRRHRRKRRIDQRHEPGDKNGTA